MLVLLRERAEEEGEAALALRAGFPIEWDWACSCEELEETGVAVECPVGNVPTSDGGGDVGEELPTSLSDMAQSCKNNKNRKM